MRTVYATQFEIGSPDVVAPADAWERTLCLVRDWVAGSYERRQIGPAFPAEGGQWRPTIGHQIEVESVEQEGRARLWILEWTHPDERDETLQWQIQVTVASVCGSIECAVLVRVSSTSFAVTPARFTLGRPAVVRTLVQSLPCANSGVLLRHTPRNLQAGEMREFVSTVLTNARRALPVVVVSRDLYSEQPVVDPTEMADRLVGLAEVVVLADKWAGFQLTDELGTKTPSCYDGAVRLYWPGFSVYAPPVHHPLWLSGTIRAYEAEGRPLCDHLMRMLAGIASFRHTDGKTIRAVREAVRQERAKHLEDLRARVAAGGEGRAELEALLNEVLNDNERLKKERDEAIVRRDELEHELDVAKANLEAAYQYQAPAEPSAPVATAAELEVELATVLDATQAAAKQFNERLIFLESAFEAAGESPFQRPDRVYQALEAIDEVCRDWRQSIKDGSSMGTWKEAFRRRGFDYKDDLSMTTRTKHGEEYKFKYEGKKRLFEKHITEGAKQPQKCFSIHIYPDETKHVVVVGHVGRHLTNTRT